MSDDGTALRQLSRDIEAESDDGRRLAADPGDNPVCCVRYDAALHGVTLVWRGYASSAQLRFVHECALHLLVAHGACALLCDDRNLVTVHVQDRIWVVDQWMPRAQHAGLRCIACTEPSTYHAQAAMSSIRAMAPCDLLIEVCRDVDDARAWLLRTGDRAASH